MITTASPLLIPRPLASPGDISQALASHFECYQITERKVEIICLTLYPVLCLQMSWHH